MSYVISQRAGRYLGDSESQVVHDLLYEVEGEDGCNIDAILRNGSAVGFFPDKKEQVRMEGFTPCPECMS